VLPLSNLIAEASWSMLVLLFTYVAQSIGVRRELMILTYRLNSLNIISKPYMSRVSLTSSLITDFAFRRPSCPFFFFDSCPDICEDGRLFSSTILAIIEVIKFSKYIRTEVLMLFLLSSSLFDVGNRLRPHALFKVFFFSPLPLCNT